MIITASNFKALEYMHKKNAKKTPILIEVMNRVAGVPTERHMNEPVDDRVQIRKRAVLDSDEPLADGH